ncbi:MAG: hypothetical protein ACLQEQ_01045 [Nitrososphaerales archaeon]
MPGIATFFRHCPSCGRRFEVRLESKKEIREDDEMGDSPHGAVANESAIGRRTIQRAAYFGPRGQGGMMHAVMEENVPMLVDDKEFQYAYKCKHCGHEWSEFHERKTEQREEGSEGYTGD